MFQLHSTLSQLNANSREGERQHVVPQRILHERRAYSLLYQLRNPALKQESRRNHESKDFTHWLNLRVWSHTSTTRWWRVLRYDWSGGVGLFSVTAALTVAQLHIAALFIITACFYLIRYRFYSNSLIRMCTADNKQILKRTKDFGYFRDRGVYSFLIAWWNKLRCFSFLTWGERIQKGWWGNKCLQLL